MPVIVTKRKRTKVEYLKLGALAVLGCGAAGAWFLHSLEEYGLPNDPHKAWQRKHYPQGQDLVRTVEELDKKGKLKGMTVAHVTALFGDEDAHSMCYDSSGKRIPVDELRYTTRYSVPGFDDDGDNGDTMRIKFDNGRCTGYIHERYADR